MTVRTQAQSSGSAPWSPRRWIAHHLGCQPGQLHVAARSDNADGTIAVTYVTHGGEQVTVLAMLATDRWRITSLQGDRWLRADVRAGRGLLW